MHYGGPEPWPFNLFFRVVLSLFWLGESFMALIIFVRVPEHDARQ